MAVRVWVKLRLKAKPTCLCLPQEECKQCVLCDSKATLKYGFGDTCHKNGVVFNGRGGKHIVEVTRVSPSLSGGVVSVQTRWLGSVVRVCVCFPQGETWEVCLMCESKVPDTARGDECPQTTMWVETGFTTSRPHLFKVSRVRLCTVSTIRKKIQKHCWLYHCCFYMRVCVMFYLCVSACLCVCVV
jgi:hypothetical protein